MSDNPNPVDGVTPNDLILQGQATEGGAPSAEPAPPASAAEPPAEPTGMTAEQYEAERKRLRTEAATWRTKLREAEEKARKYDEWQEAQKSELERATDRATAAEQERAKLENELIVLRVAAKYGVPEEDYDFLGSGTQEEVDARGARYAARFAATSTPTPPPPSDRPVESLRPGASPTPPPPADHSYPAAWKP